MKKIKHIYQTIQTWMLNHIVWILGGAAAFGVLSSIVGTIWGDTILEMVPYEVRIGVVLTILIPLVIFYAIPAFYWAGINTWKWLWGKD